MAAPTKKIKITLVRSLISERMHQRRVCAALGLRRINQSVVRSDSPQVRGMVNSISYLLNVEDVKE